MWKKMREKKREREKKGKKMGWVGEKKKCSNDSRVRTLVGSKREMMSCHWATEPNLNKFGQNERVNMLGDAGSASEHLSL